MRVVCISLLVSLICVTGTVFAAPDEEPAATKAVAQNVSVQLMDFGEGADRKIKLTLSDKWSNLPDSTKKHVLSKLKAVLPQESLKQALLALAKGETEIEVSAAPGQKAPAARAMVKLVPATPMVRVMPATPLVPAKRVIVKQVEKQPGAFALRGTKGDNVEIEILEVDNPDEIDEEVRKKLLEALKARADWEGVDGFPTVKRFEVKGGKGGGCPNCARQPKIETRVVVAGDGNWKELPPETRKQVLDSLRQSVPPEQMAEVLKALTQGGSPQAGFFYLQPMPGKPGCACGKAAPRKPGCACGKVAPRKPGCACGKVAPQKPGCKCGGPGAPRPPMAWVPGAGFPGPVQFGMRGRGGRMHPGAGNQQGALVRALVALTNEVRALRSEVAAMRATHQGRPPVLRPNTQSQPPRRMMVRSMGVGGAAGTASKFVTGKPKCLKCQGECKCATKPPPPPPHTVRLTSKDGTIGMGGGTGGGMMVMPKPNRKHNEVEQDMAKLRAEMAEIRAALHRLMKDLQKLQSVK